MKTVDNKSCWLAQASLPLGIVCTSIWYTHIIIFFFINFVFFVSTNFIITLIIWLQMGNLADKQKLTSLAFCWRLHTFYRIIVFIIFIQMTTSIRNEQFFVLFYGCKFTLIPINILDQSMRIYFRASICYQLSKSWTTIIVKIFI